MGEVGGLRQKPWDGIQSCVTKWTVAVRSEDGAASTAGGGAENNRTIDPIDRNNTSKLLDKQPFRHQN